MVLTQITLTLCVVLSSIIVSVLIGAIGKRSFGNATGISVIVFLIVVPIAMYAIYLVLEIYVMVLDWPITIGSLLSFWNPFTVILIASWLGGVLGMISGKYWEEGDRSCLQCLLGPFIVIFAISIVILVL